MFPIVLRVVVVVLLTTAISSCALVVLVELSVFLVRCVYNILIPSVVAFLMSLFNVGLWLTVLPSNDVLSLN